MKANPWFRMYSDFMYDDKIELLAFEDQRHYIVILCMKNAGLLDKEYPQPGMLDRVASKRLGLFGEAFESARRRLIDAGLIDNKFQPIAWDARQYLSDSSTERVQAYRERMKRVKRPCNVSVTSQEAETETEAETDKYSIEFEHTWLAYPDRPGKSKAASFKAWNARLKAGCSWDEMQAGVLAYAAYCKAARTEPGYIKQPATFFGPDLHFRSEWKVTGGSSHGRVPNVQPGDIGDIPDAD